MALLNLIGMGVILFAWLIQGYRIHSSKSAHINMDFVVLYVIGVVLIASEGFRKGAVIESSINIVIGITALTVGISAFMKVR